MKGLSAPPESLCDEFGEVSRQVDAFGPVLMKHKRLKSEIEAFYTEANPALEYTAKGNLYTVQIDVKANQRNIPAKGMRRLFRTLGQSKFLEWCTFKLSDLDRLVSDTTGIVEEEQSGPRKIKAVAIEAVQPTKKAA